MSFTPELLSKLYRVPNLIDYEYSDVGVWQDRGDWLLVAAGSGIMMSVMDAEKRFRWCIDLDGIGPQANLEQWLIGMEKLAGRICLVGGWAITSPAAVIAAMRGLKREVLVYPIVVPGNPFTGHPFVVRGTLAAFIEELKAFGQTEPEDCLECFA